MCAGESAIAALLCDIDDEIAALEVRRDKTRALKQGMMQELLTGRIRLVEPRKKPDDWKAIAGEHAEAAAAIPLTI